MPIRLAQLCDAAISLTIARAMTEARTSLVRPADGQGLEARGIVTEELSALGARRKGCGAVQRRKEIPDMTDSIEFECRDSTAWIAFNRPNAKNALSAEMMDDLQALLNGLADNPKVRVVVISGKGSDFCSGSDVGAMAAMLTLSPGERAARFHRAIDERIVPLFHAFRRLSQPVVA